MNELFVFIKLESINNGSGFLNLNVIDKDKKRFNVKVEKDFNCSFEVDQIYWAKVIERKDPLRDKNNYYLEEIKNLFDLNYDLEGIENVLNNFYEFKKSLVKQRNRIYTYIEEIDNSILKDLTFYLIDKYKDKFFLYPAATKFHHTQIGGIVDHTLGMLDLAEGIFKKYPEVSRSLVISGILLHDLMKVFEYDQVINSKLTRESLMIGHITMIVSELNLASVMYKYEDSEEVFLLKHILLSHHGQMNFGSPKKPQTVEAFIVNFLDSFDSKIVMILEALNKTEDKSFTEMVGVADRTEFYKHNVK